VCYPIAGNKKRLIVFSVAMGFATLSAAGGLRGPVRNRVEWGLGCTTAPERGKFLRPGLPARSRAACCRSAQVPPRERVCKQYSP